MRGERGWWELYTLACAAVCGKKEEHRVDMVERGEKEGRRCIPLACWLLRCVMLRAHETQALRSACVPAQQQDV